MRGRRGSEGEGWEGVRRRRGRGMRGDYTCTCMCGGRRVPSVRV